MHRESLSLAVVLAVVLQVTAHPQCLDFKPPFKPLGTFQMCKDFETFGCCNARDDAEIAQKFYTLSNTMSPEQLSSCGSYLSSLLCQKCSPYAAHIYDAEDRPVARSFPGLCRSYCKKMMPNCWYLVEMITNDATLTALAKQEDHSEFCQAVKPSDIDYCYPKLISNPLLNTGIGTIGFYRRKNPLFSSFSSCIRMCVEEVANGLLNPLSLKHARDGTHRIFVAEQVGIIWVYLPDKSRLSVPFLNIRDIVLLREQTYDERGLLDIEFHPNYKENGIFYLYYTILINGHHHIKISEMRVSTTDMNVANTKTERTLLTVREPAFNHNGGQLLFGIDGYLYIFTGDGGAAGDPFGPYGNAQNKKILLGKVLRIDVNSRGRNGKPYAIPPDNPFVNNPNYLPEIYALGVRNMWRCGMDRGNETGHNRGRIFCGDVGQGQYEEIDIIQKGANYGWRAYEGYQCYDRNMCNKKFIKNHVPPIHAYHHSVGKSVTGGYVYRGCQYPNLRGQYIFGDFTFGKLFLLRETPTGKWKRSDICMGSRKICKNGGLQNHYSRYILSFGEDESGELYMLSTYDPIPGRRGGSVYRLVDPSRRSDPSTCETTIEDTVVAPTTKKIPYKKNIF